MLFSQEINKLWIKIYKRYFLSPLLISLYTPPSMKASRYHDMMFSSVAQLCPSLCDPMDCSTPGLPVHHQTPGVYSDSCPLSQWCHLTISFSVIPFSSCLQSFLASGSFQMSQFFASGGQSIGVSASASVLPANIQDWLPLGWTGWISMAVQETLKSLLQYHSSKASVLRHSAFFIVQLSHPYIATRKTITSTRWTFVGKVMYLLFNVLSRLVITFLPRSKRLLISWLQSPSTVILEPKKIKSLTVSTVSPSICHEVMGPDAMMLVFWMLSSKPTFSSFTFIQRFFSSSLSAIRVVSSAYLGLLIFLPSNLDSRHDAGDWNFSLWHFCREVAE